jgi:hypothetical protein
MNGGDAITEMIITTFSVFIPVHHGRSPNNITFYHHYELEKAHIQSLVHYRAKISSPVARDYLNPPCTAN